MADFVNQGTVKKRRGVKLYAWGVSICAHAVVLSVFTAVQLSQPKADVKQAGAVVSINQAAMLADRPAATPKPKVVNSSRAIIRTSQAAKPMGTRQTFELPTKDSSQPIEFDKAEDKPETYVPAGNEPTTAQTEFFGSTAQGRRICYVVDCSGSMQGLWQGVRRELRESIGQLQPDQYFCVIVFGAGSVLDSGGGRLVRATEQTKREAYDFIGSVQPRGTTNAIAALEHAIKIRDRTGVGPSVLYFLTDGFELSEQDNSRFAQQVGTMLRSFSPKTQINTIGFWPEERDRKLLETMARESGGEFIVVDSDGP